MAELTRRHAMIFIATFVFAVIGAAALFNSFYVEKNKHLFICAGLTVEPLANLKICMPAPADILKLLQEGSAT